MPLGSILLIAALTFIVVLYLFNPFLSTSNLGQKESNLASSLLAERERLLSAILELENDYSMGKVPEEIFDIQRNSLTKKAVDVLKALDSQTVYKEDSELEKMIQLHKNRKS
jgi:hypothetical protein